MAMATDREPVMEMCTVTGHLHFFITLHTLQKSVTGFLLCPRSEIHVCTYVCVFQNNPVWVSLGTPLVVSQALVFRSIWCVCSHGNPHV